MGGSGDGAQVVNPEGTTMTPITQRDHGTLTVDPA
jgi:hypothetical protein